MLYTKAIITVALATLTSAIPATNSEHSALHRRYTTETGNAIHAFTDDAPQTCGTSEQRPSDIVALPARFNVPSLCGQYVSITNIGTEPGNNGKKNGLLATVYGTCANCNENDLGLDKVAFNALLTNRSIINPPPPPTEFAIEWHLCGANGDC